jgi:phosphinothricin acetyltransferase
VLVRAATVADVDAINDIHAHYVRTTPITFDVDPWTHARRAEWLALHPDHGRHRVLVAVDGDEVVGWASTSRYKDKGAYDASVECSVFVRDGLGGRGIGRAMYAELFSRLAAENVHRAYAQITLPNDASIALHERTGFRRVATFTEVGHKFDRYWDVVWFERLMP